VTERGGLGTGTPSRWLGGAETRGVGWRDVQGEEHWGGGVENVMPGWGVEERGPCKTGKEGKGGGKTRHRFEGLGLAVRSRYGLSRTKRHLHLNDRITLLEGSVEGHFMGS